MAPKTTGPAVSTQPAIMKPTEEPPAYSQAQPQVYVLMVYSQITAVISVELLAMLTAAAVVSATFFSGILIFTQRNADWVTKAIGTEVRALRVTMSKQTVVHLLF